MKPRLNAALKNRGAWAMQPPSISAAAEQLREIDGGRFQQGVARAVKALNLPPAPASAPLVSDDQLQRLCDDFSGFTPEPLQAMRFRASLENALTFHGYTELNLPMIVAMLLQQVSDLRQHLTTEAIKKEGTAHVHLN